MQAVISLIMSFFIMIFSFLGVNSNEVYNVDDYYPTSKSIGKDDVIYSIKRDSLSSAEQFFVVSLQGILAKQQPKIYIETASKSEAAWKQNIIDSGVEIKEVNLNQLVRALKAETNMKYVLFDSVQSKGNEKNLSVNAASTIAGMEGYVLVDSSLKEKAENWGFTMGSDARDISTLEVFYKYQDRLNKNIIINQFPDREPLRDFGIQNGALFMFADYEESDLTNELIYAWANMNAGVYGWTTNETKFVKKLSQKGLMLYAADWSCNLSFYSGLKVDKIEQCNYEQRDLKADSSKHYLAIIMSDGDNLQWMSNNFLHQEKYYASNFKGDFPMTWGISPALSKLAPTLMQTIYNNATSKDQFITGPGGASYARISQYLNYNLDEYAGITSDLMEKSDMNYINFIDKESKKTDLIAFAQQDNIRGGIWFDGDKYIGGQGKVYWSNGKPFITVKETLWNIESNEESNSKYGSVEVVADRINTYESNPTSENGYTVLVAHAWSIGTMDDINEFVKLLDEDVELVTVGEIVELMIDNITH